MLDTTYIQNNIGISLPLKLNFLYNETSNDVFAVDHLHVHRFCLKKERNENTLCPISKKESQRQISQIELALPDIWTHAYNARHPREVICVILYLLAIALLC